MSPSLISKGRGEPVDALDAACKSWHQCRACTKIDNRNCNPSYSGHPYVQYGHYDLTSDCVTPEAPNHCIYNQIFHSIYPSVNPPLTQEQSTCSYNNCRCDEQLALDIVSFYQRIKNGQATLSTNYVSKSDGTGFDYNHQCSSEYAEDAGLDGNNNPIGMPIGFSTWTLACCGEYPNRKPYKTNRNSCCAKKELVPLGVC